MQQNKTAALTTYSCSVIDNLFAELFSLVFQLKVLVLKTKKSLRLI